MLELRKQSIDYPNKWTWKAGKSINRLNLEEDHLTIILLNKTRSKESRMAEQLKLKNGAQGNASSITNLFLKIYKFGVVKKSVL